MRRPIAVLLVVCAAAAATMALGSALAARSTAAKSPLAGLDRTFRSLQPAARCAPASETAARARRLRAAALKNAAKAPPKVVKRKKAAMRRAIRLLRRAGDLCEAPPAGGAPGSGGGAPPPYGQPPGPAPAPPPPGAQIVALGTVSSGVGFVPNQGVTVAAGTIHFQLTNASSTLTHSIGVRTVPGQMSLGLAGNATPGGVTSVDIALATPGTYQIYCGFGTHAAQGMVVPLIVAP
jgi:hypothetical protein